MQLFLVLGRTEIVPPASCEESIYSLVVAVTSHIPETVDHPKAVLHLPLQSEGVHPPHPDCAQKEEQIVCANTKLVKTASTSNTLKLITMI